MEVKIMTSKQMNLHTTSMASLVFVLYNFTSETTPLEKQLRI